MDFTIPTETPTTTDVSALTQIFPFFGALGAFMIVIAIIGLVTLIFWIIDVYHLVTTDSSDFPGGVAGKKKWFILLIVLSLLGFIPLIGMFIMLAWFILVFVYFFTVRTKGKAVTAAPPQAPTETPENK